MIGLSRSTFVTARLTTVQTHTLALRGGPVSSVVVSPTAQNALMTSVLVDPAGLGAGVSMTVTIEHFDQGETFFLVRQQIDDLLDRVQIENPIKLRAAEQIKRSDVFNGKGWAYSHHLEGADTRYRVLALEKNIRVTIETSAPVTYSASLTMEKLVAPKVPLGQQSASLVGTFTSAEGAGTLTTGSRTTVQGSLITAQSSHFHDSSGLNLAVPTDNKSNSYQEPTNGEIEFSNAAGSFANINCAYNINGSRGSSHTISSTGGGINSSVLQAQEWDGVHFSPTVASATNTNTGGASSLR